MYRNRGFLIFANNPRSKQNKKIPAYPFVDIPGLSETIEHLNIA